MLFSCTCIFIRILVKNEINLTFLWQPNLTNNPILESKNKALKLGFCNIFQNMSLTAFPMCKQHFQGPFILKKRNCWTARYFPVGWPNFFKLLDQIDLGAHFPQLYQLCLYDHIAQSRFHAKLILANWWWKII